MKFKEYKKQNFSSFDYFKADEMSFKGFIKLSFDQALNDNKFDEFMLDIDNKALNSSPNFTQKHPVCISHLKFQNNTFQFRICCENKVNSLGYRLFIKREDTLDYLTQDINEVDKIALWLKDEILTEHSCISKCGWWITDTWRDMFVINDTSESESFIREILTHPYTSEMIKINEKLHNLSFKF
ncbi:hypothetical protein LMG7974_00139 [Campylobacter majalis]|uniref:Uncharacterized protein n=1 Tax=Campylobacter majalis TaxID=2790656 RepID=A0ABN7K833_9BACT|nr:effector protein [Campylobacter majalis]CAD7286897.1 hypothetical protein LMG7974_00139 [Campylobacter majalis]